MRTARDLRKYARSTPKNSELLEWAERQRGFDRPVLVVWKREDKIMPPGHGRRLADLFPGGRSPRSPTATPSSRKTSPPGSPP